jgi:hypothetical protein
MPLSSVEYTGIDVSTLLEGMVIHMLNGHEICTKYIPRHNPQRSSGREGNRTRKKRVNVAPLFAEHADTEQLAYNLADFHCGDHIEITLKMHGTSQRTGYLPVLKKFKKSLLDYILRREGTPIYDWDYVTGTRRTVLQNYDGGYYGDNAFREQHSKMFEGKLNKGETVYYEVVGFTSNGTPIMGSGNNARLNDKEFIKQYGEITTFSYGCEASGEKIIFGKDEDGIYSLAEPAPQSDLYVYRMTMTNEDGFTTEYTPDFMRYRCEQMGVKCVPVFATMKLTENGGWIYRKDGTFTAVCDSDLGDFVQFAAEEFYDGPDPVGKTHVREGVVVRIINRPKFTAYKHKNFSFKVLEGIVKSSAEAPDMEEADGLVEEE